MVDGWSLLPNRSSIVTYWWSLDDVFMTAKKVFNSAHSSLRRTFHFQLYSQSLWLRLLYSITSLIQVHVLVRWLSLKLSPQDPNHSSITSWNDAKEAGIQKLSKVYTTLSQNWEFESKTSKCSFRCSTFKVFQEYNNGLSYTLLLNHISYCNRCLELKGQWMAKALCIPVSTVTWYVACMWSVL